MNIDDIFRPMNIITNYESYKKILKKYKKEIMDSASLEDNEKILNQCKKELDSFYSKIMWKSVGILIVYLLFVLIINFKLKKNIKFDQMKTWTT